jgi:hypothetical protein
MGWSTLALTLLASDKCQLSVDHLQKEHPLQFFPLFLITLPRSSKSQEVFKLRSLCNQGRGVLVSNIITTAANFKQPTSFMWCGGGHPHKECSEKRTASWVPICCNYELVTERNVVPQTTERLSRAT